MTSWVVEFTDCDEAVIRDGTLESVNYPDDLGCPVSRIRPLADVKLKDMPWDKNGELRCEVVREQQNTTQEDLNSTTDLNGGAKTTDGGKAMVPFVDYKLARDALLYWKYECSGAEPSLSVFNRMVDDALTQNYDFDGEAKDAKRYQWLRVHPAHCANLADNQIYSRNRSKPALFDAAIDAAMMGG